LRYRERRLSLLALFDNLDSQHFLQSDCRGVPVFSCLETNAPLEEDIFFRGIVKRQRRGEKKMKGEIMIRTENLADIIPHF